MLSRFLYMVEALAFKTIFRPLTHKWDHKLIDSAFSTLNADFSAIIKEMEDTNKKLNELKTDYMTFKVQSLAGTSQAPPFPKPEIEVYLRPFHVYITQNNHTYYTQQTASSALNALDLAMLRFRDGPCRTYITVGNGDVDAQVYNPASNTIHYYTNIDISCGSPYIKCESYHVEYGSI